MQRLFSRMALPKSSSGKRSTTRGSLGLPGQARQWQLFIRHSSVFLFPSSYSGFSPSKSSPGILPLSHPRASAALPGDLLDCRVKPEYDGKKNKPDNGRKRRKSCSGLTRASKKHKALAHDIHVESNALQQRFVPQPVLRSSWQQLVLETVNRPWAYSGALKPRDNFFF